MRYTTIIDLSEQAKLYANVNVRLLYLHMCLKAGYHDTDRDLLDSSIRRLAAETGLTIAATRHALKQLEAASLIARTGALFFVRKWLPEQSITARQKTAKQQQRIEQQAAAELKAAERDRQLEIERAKREQLQQQGKTTFMAWYENQQALAAAGDTAAAAAVSNKRNVDIYEQHKQQVLSQKK